MPPRLSHSRSVAHLRLFLPVNLVKVLLQHIADGRVGDG